MEVTGRIPCLVEAQEYSAGYLAAKQRRMAHLMEKGGHAGGADASAAGPAPGLGFSGTTPAARRARQEAADAAAAALPPGVAVVGEAPDDDQELDGSFCIWDHSGEPTSAGLALEPLPEGHVQ